MTECLTDLVYCQRLLGKIVKQNQVSINNMKLLICVGLRKEISITKEVDTITKVVE